MFGYLADDGLYYGFPVYGEVAVKIGIDGAGPVVTPETRTYARDEARVGRALAFLERYLPGAVGPELYTRACCYDFPPDRDFIVDYVPGSQRVLVVRRRRARGQVRRAAGPGAQRACAGRGEPVPGGGVQRYPAGAERRGRCRGDGAGQLDVAGRSC